MRWLNLCVCGTIEAEVDEEEYDQLPPHEIVPEDPAEGEAREVSRPIR